MIAPLNPQGYVRHDSPSGLWFHIPFFHQFAEPGAVFDQASCIQCITRALYVYLRVS
jgi:hypothetical protein